MLQTIPGHLYYEQVMACEVAVRCERRCNDKSLSFAYA